MYKYIIFDFDGTIVDSAKFIDNILGDLAFEHNIKSFSPKALKHRENLSVAAKIQLLFFILKGKSEYFKRYKENIPAIKAFDKMLDLLYILNKNDFKLAVVSSNKEDNILEFFKVNNVNLDIEVFVSRGLFDKSKVIKRFIKRNRFTRTDVLYVGDEIRDIKACEKSSVDIAFVKWGLDGNENIDMYKPKFVVCSQDELKKIICE